MDLRHSCLQFRVVGRDLVGRFKRFGRFLPVAAEFEAPAFADRNSGGEILFPREALLNLERLVDAPPLEVDSRFFELRRQGIGGAGAACEKTCP